MNLSKKHLIRKFIVVLLSVLFAQGLFAKKVLKELVLPFDSLVVLGGIISDDFYDIKKDAAANSFTDVESKGIIKLVTTNELLENLPAISSVTVYLNITYDTFVPNASGVGGSYVSTTIPDTLSISYRPNGGNYIGKSFISIPGAYRISYAIGSIDYDIVPSSNFPIVDQYVSLVSSIEVERYFPLTTMSMPYVDDSKLSTKGEIEFKWTPIANAEEYDLEWTEINAYSGSDDLEDVLTPAQIKIDNNLFERNSTRVTVTGSSYAIPYIYDRGYIVYRIRPVGRKLVNGELVRNEGAWTVVLTSSCNNLACSDLRGCVYDGTKNPHNENLNWQYTVNYAEEGKSKLSMTYADGSMRTRQAQTRVNTDEKIIVGETIYDHQGRPVVQALPAPSEEQKVGFIPGFNRSSTEETAGGTEKKAYSRADFDYDMSDCGSAPNAMFPIEGADVTAANAVQGAAKYYSTFNPNKNNENAYTPISEGYPFSQVQYTSDNTGRIKEQGGVGKDMQIEGDGSGHTTKYFYYTPTQIDLDRLFGNEVGYAQYYKKNMVVDPNKQVSISYLDPTGKVIATALSGKNPDALEALPSQAAATVTLNAALLGNGDGTESKGQQSVIDAGLTARTATFSKPIGVDTENDVRTFHYEIPKQKFQDNILRKVYDDNGNEIPELRCETVKCYDCVFDLDFSLKDKCMTEFLTQDAAHQVLGKEILDAVKTDADGFFNGNAPVAPCSGTGTYVVDLVTGDKDKNSMTTGAYKLNKVLRVNEEVLNANLKDYLNNDCVFDEDYFKQKELKKVNFSGCLSCDECKDPILKDIINNYYNAVNKADSTSVYVNQLPATYKVQENENCTTCFSSEEDFQIFVEFCKSGSCDFDVSPVYGAKIAAMLLDMSPHGQYGQLLESGGLDNNGNFIEPSANETYVPEKFPLSIYNPNNSLPVKSVPELNGIQKMPTWRYPYYVSKPDLLSNKYYTINDEGDEVEAFVMVEKNVDPVTGAITYSPEVLDEAQLIHVVDNRYKISPQYLKKLEDFVAKFDPHWARSLLYYHPEYIYSVLCRDAIPSQDFDHQLRNYTYKEVLDKYGSAMNSNSNFALMDIDPFFSKTYQNNPIYYNYPFNLKKMMKFKLTYYTYDKVEEKWLNAWQAAWVTNNMQSNSGCSDRLDPSAQIIEFNAEDKNDEKVWNTFKEIYISLKNEVYESLQAHYTIEAGSYCGCIGDDDFWFGKENYYQHLFPYVQTYKTWHWWRGKETKKRIAFRSQIFNPFQPCDVSKYFLYKDKKAHFATINSALDLTIKEPELCPSPTEYGKFVECDDDMFAIPATSPSALKELERIKENTLEKIEQSKQIADQSIMETCKLCPNAKSLEGFLNYMAETETFEGSGVSLLVTDNWDLSCKTPMFFQELENQLPGSGPVTWRIYPVPHPFLNIDLERPDGNSIIELWIRSNEDAQYYGYEDIKKICCIDVLSESEVQELFFKKGYNFTVSAVVEIDPADPAYDPHSPYSTKQIVLEGVSSDFNIGDCDDLKVPCQLTEQGKDMLELFTMLAYDSPAYPSENIPAFPSKFLASGVNLTAAPDGDDDTEDSPFAAFVSEKLRNHFDNVVNPTIEETTWYWNTNRIGNVVTATINSAPGVYTGDCQFTFTFPTASTFDAVVGVKNIKPVQNNPKAFTMVMTISNAGVEEDVNVECVASNTIMYNCPAEPVTVESQARGNSGSYICTVTTAAEALLTNLNTLDFSDYSNEDSHEGIPYNYYKYTISMNNPGKYFLSDVINGSLTDISVDQTTDDPSCFVVHAKVNDNNYGNPTVLLKGKVRPDTLGLDAFVVGECNLKSTTGCTVSEDGKALEAAFDQFVKTNNWPDTDYMHTFSPGEIIKSAVTVNTFRVDDYNDIVGFSDIQPIKELCYEGDVSEELKVLPSSDTYVCANYGNCINDSYSDEESLLISKHRVVNTLWRDAYVKFDISSFKLSNKNIYLRLFVNSVIAESSGFGIMKVIYYNTLDGATYNSIGSPISDNIGFIPCNETSNGKWVEFDITKSIKEHPYDFITLRFYLLGDDYNSYTEISLGSMESENAPCLVERENNGFTILAHLEDGSVAKVTGFTNGIKIGDCPCCREVEPANFKEDFESGNTDGLVYGEIEENLGNHFVIGTYTNNSDMKPYYYADINLEPNKKYVVSFKLYRGFRGENYFFGFRNPSTPINTPINAPYNGDIPFEWMLDMGTGNYVFPQLGCSYYLPMDPSYEGENWFTYKYSFTATESQVRLIFGTDSPGGGVYEYWRLDDISVNELDCGDSKSPLCGGYAPTPDLGLGTLKQQCLDRKKEAADAPAKRAHDEYIQGIRDDFKERYIKKCLSVYEKLDMSYSSGEHHYTLYYYDQAGNLVKTIPPEGVNVVTDQADLDQIIKDRNEGTRVFYTEHTMPTTYTYNSLNQLTNQSMPDQDNMNIWEMEAANAQIPSNYEVQSISFITSEVGFLSATDGTDSYVYYTVNGGKTWSKVSVSGLSDINDFDVADFGLAVGNDGLVLKIEDGGATVVTFPTKVDLKQVCFLEYDRINVYSVDGRLWRTNDRVDSWEGPKVGLSNLLSGGLLDDISFYGERIAFATGKNGRLYRSDDYGVNWYRTSEIKHAATINAVNHSFQNGIAYAAGASGSMMKHVSGANPNWTLMTNNITEDIVDIYFDKTGQHGNAVSATGIYHSADYGKTWTKDISATISNLSFVDLNASKDKVQEYGALIEAGRYLKTTDNAGETWNTIQDLSLPSISCLQTINDKKYYFANNNTIMRLSISDSNVKTEESINTPLISDIKEIHFVDDEDFTGADIPGVVLTASGDLWYLDSDLNWQNAASGIVDMDFKSLNQGYALKGDGELYRLTFDVDDNTMVVASASNPIYDSSTPFRKLSVNNIPDATLDQITLVGDAGRLFTSQNSGQTWIDETKNILLPSKLNSIHAISNTQVLAAGDNGILLEGDGTTYTIRNSGVTDNLNAIVDGVVVGDNACVLTGSGSAWTKQPVSVTTNLNAVYKTSTGWLAAGDNITVIDPTSVLLQNSNGDDDFTEIKKVGRYMYAVGEKGKVCTNYSGSWMPINEFQPGVIADIFMLDKNLGYAVGNDGKMFKITESGATWTDLALESTFGPTTNLLAVHFTSADEGIVVSQNGVFRFKNNNEGGSWTPMTLPSGFVPRAVHFSNAQYGAIVGEAGRILMSNNGINPKSGVEPFSEVTVPGSNQLNAVFLLDNKFGYAVGDNNAILILKDGVWSERIFTAAERADLGINASENFTDVQFIDRTTGYITGDKGTLLKTTNYGQTWTKQTE